jgi:hypothetical protein
MTSVAPQIIERSIASIALWVRRHWNQLTGGSGKNLVPVEFQTLPLQVSHTGYQTVTIQVRTISEHRGADVPLQRQR